MKKQIQRCDMDPRKIQNDQYTCYDFFCCADFFIQKINPGKTAVISVDSEIIEKIYLETHKNNTFSLENVKGVVFEVNNGKIRIIESDCPDKICVKTDFIDSKSEKIVCLPKKLIVEIED